MTPARRRALAAAAAIVLATAVAVVAPDAGTISGTLEVAHSDDFVNAPEPYFWLKTGDRRIRLHTRDRSLEAKAGARVRVRGPRVAAADDTGASEAIALEEVVVLADAPLPAPAAKRIAVILVNFTDDTSQPESVAQINAITFGAPNSVRAFFEEESRGRVTVTGDVFGWYTLPVSKAGCNWSSWGTQARAAATNAGHDLSGYTNVVTHWPVAQCGWAGLGYVGGPYSFINDYFGLRVVAHELGHNFSIWHASSTSCTLGGVRVTYSASCTNAEYGDPFTVMGAGQTFHDHGLHVGQMGWLDPAELVTVTADGTYQVAPLLTAGGPKLLRVRRPGGPWFYVDYRVPFGAIFDKFAAGSPVVTGVSIRASTNDLAGSHSNTLLLDNTPATTTFTDSPLAVGRTFVDGTLRITLVSVGATAQVRVEGLGTTSPSAAPTVAPTATPTAAPTPVSTPPPTAPPPSPSPTVGPSPGSVTFVRTIAAGSRSVSGNTALVLSVTAPLNVGQTVAVAAAAGTFSGAVSCSDSKGNSYTVDAGSGRLFVCSARVTTALGSGDTITATYPGFSGGSVAVAVVLSGSTSVGPAATASGNSAAPSVAGSGLAAFTWSATPTFTAGCGAVLAGEASSGAGSGRKALAVVYGPSVCGALTSARSWLAARVTYQ